MTITARYAGKCAGCGGAIAAGQQIEWDQKMRQTYHPKCASKANEPAPHKLSGGSGYGCQGWTAGQTLRTSDRLRERGYPEYVTVVRAGSQYVREDGMSFGVGDESGYRYWADCREATEEEAAPVRERHERAAARKAAKACLTELAQQVRDTGERPEGEHIPEGDRPKTLDTQTIYGGGDWWVIGTDYIWYVKNNGADGDDWRYNNVRTGGAGAIGWRVPATKELAAELRQIAEVIA